MNRKRVCKALAREAQVYRLTMQTPHTYTTHGKRIRSIMRRIRICPVCRGDGLVYVETGMQAQGMEYEKTDSGLRACPPCLGSGRLW